MSFAELFDANSRSHSTISALDSASITLSPAWKVAKLAKCWCESTKAGSSAPSPRSTAVQFL